MTIQLRTITHHRLDRDHGSTIVAVVLPTLSILVAAFAFFGEQRKEQRNHERTAANLRAAECRLVAIDPRHRNGIWECGGVNVAHRPAVLAAWQATTGEATP